MHESDPHQPAALHQSELLHDPDRVVVAVPYIDSPSPHFCSHRLWAHADDIHCKRGDALLPHFRWSVQPHRRHLGDSGQEPRAEALFVSANRGKRRLEPASATDALTERRQVLDGSRHRHQRLEGLGPRLPPVGRRVGRRTDLVRSEALEVFSSPVEDPGVRAEELVGARHQEVGLKRGDVR